MPFKFQIYEADKDERYDRAAEFLSTRALSMPAVVRVEQLNALVHYALVSECASGRLLLFVRSPTYEVTPGLDGFASQGCVIRSQGLREPSPSRPRLR